MASKEPTDTFTHNALKEMFSATQVLPSAKFASKLANHGSAVIRGDWRVIRLEYSGNLREWSLCRLSDATFLRTFSKKSNAATRQFVIIFIANGG